MLRLLRTDSDHSLVLQTLAGRPPLRGVDQQQPRDEALGLAGHRPHRASNEGSRIFHNYVEGPYLGTGGLLSIDFG